MDLMRPLQACTRTRDASGDRHALTQACADDLSQTRVVITSNLANSMRRLIFEIALDLFGCRHLLAQ